MTSEDIKNKSVGFVSLGCDKNRVDLEKMIFDIQSFGLQIVDDPSQANIIIVNTCSFLESARLESIETIVEMANYKINGNLEKLIVTGCLNELNYPDLSESLPEVDLFLNVKDDNIIVEKLLSLYGINEEFKTKNGRTLTTNNHYSYLKIAEGCNNFCSYCLIPYIRGRYKSTPKEELVNEAKNLASKGVKELIIVAQDITKYGIDIYGKKCLSELLNEISTIEGIDWIRLLYCYPEEIDDELISTIKNNDKIVKYIDIPLQHVSNNILKQMNRKSTYEKITSVINKLRSEIPSIIIRTTFILGFPGETEKDFDILCNFIKEYKLNNVGFFAYSREEGTRSYNFDNQIDDKTKQKRVEIASQIQYEVLKEINQKFIGKTFNCIIDEVYDDYSIARFYGQCIDIDSIIYINQPLIVGNTYNVKINKIVDYDFEGEIL